VSEVGKDVDLIPFVLLRDTWAVRMSCRTLQAELTAYGFADLAAAAPDEGVGSAFAAGAVSVIPGSAGGLTATGGQLFTQNSPGVPGVAEAFDQFGGVAFNAG